MMWLYSDAPEDPMDDNVLDKDDAEAWHSHWNTLMQAIWMEHEEIDQDAVDGIIQIVKPWMISRWSALAPTHGKPLVELFNENALLVDIEFNEIEQAQLQTLVERKISQSSSEAWRVNRRQQAHFLYILGDTSHHIDDFD